jgi:hypothetical protein
MHLGELSESEVSHLGREFGVHVDLSRESVMFPETAAALSLKQIVAEDFDRAALFRKKAKWLYAWVTKIPTEPQRLRQPRP